MLERFFFFKAVDLSKKLEELPTFRYNRWKEQLEDMKTIGKQNPQPRKSRQSAASTRNCSSSRIGECNGEYSRVLDRVIHPFLKHFRHISQTWPDPSLTISIEENSSQKSWKKKRTKYSASWVCVFYRQFSLTTRITMHFPLKWALCFIHF